MATIADAQDHRWRREVADWVEDNLSMPETLRRVRFINERVMDDFDRHQAAWRAEDGRRRKPRGKEPLNPLGLDSTDPDSLDDEERGAIAAVKLIALHDLERGPDVQLLPFVFPANGNERPFEAVGRAAYRKLLPRSAQRMTEAQARVYRAWVMPFLRAQPLSIPRPLPAVVRIEQAADLLDRFAMAIPVLFDTNVEDQIECRVRDAPFKFLEPGTTVELIWKAIVAFDHAIKVMAVRGPDGLPAPLDRVGVWDEWIMWTTPEPFGADGDDLLMTAKAVAVWYSTKREYGNDPDGKPWVRIPQNAAVWAANAAAQARAIAARLRKRAEDGHVITAVHSAFSRFERAVETATEAESDGGRRVTGVEQAIVISEATTSLHRSLANAEQAIWDKYGRIVSPTSLPFSLVESDSPTGPFAAVPAGAVSVALMPVGAHGADAALLSALRRAIEVTGFSAAKWNALQQRKPGGPHQRWHAGESLTRSQLETVASAQRLVRLQLPNADQPLVPPHPMTANGRIVTDNGEREDSLPHESENKRGKKENPPRQKPRRGAWLGVAMRIVSKYPEWSDARVAKEADVHPSQLSRNSTYQQAALLARTGRITDGFVNCSGEGAQLDAIDDDFDVNRPASRQSDDEEELDLAIDSSPALRTDRNTTRNEY